MDQLDTIQTEDQPAPARAWLVFVIIYLFIDYARPQDTIKVLGYLRPSMFMVIILTIFIIRNRQLINWKIPQIRMALFFIMLLALEIPFAVNRHKAFNTVTTLLLMMPFVISSTCCVHTLNRLKTVLFYVLLFMAYQAQFAIRHHGCGTGSQFFDENDLSLFINTWLPFCFTFFISEKTPWKKIMFGIMGALGIAANVIGRSRGGFMGLIVMFFIFWLFNPKKLVSLLVIGIIAISLYLFAGEQYWGRISTSSKTNEGTAKARIESWKSGWKMFKANPLGVGGNNFQVRFSEYQTDWFQRGMWGRVAHSLWFTLLPETGLIGTFIYLFLLFINFRDVFRLRVKSKLFNEEDSKFLKNLSVSLIASLAGFFTSATFISVLYYSHYWYICGIIASSTLIINNSTAPIPDRNPADVT